MPRRSRPALPARPAYPAVSPLPPLPQQQQRFGSASAADAGSAAGRRSLDSLSTPGSRPAAATGGGMEAGSRSMLLPPPNASTYSLQVDPRFLHHGGSYLSAALEQSMVLAQPGGAGGHLTASATSASQRGGSSSGMGAGGGRLNLSAQWNPADSGMQLVARARRSLPQPASIAQQMRMQPALIPPGELCSGSLLTMVRLLPPACPGRHALKPGARCQTCSAHSIFECPPHRHLQPPCPVQHRQPALLAATAASGMQ